MGGGSHIPIRVSRNPVKNQRLPEPYQDTLSMTEETKQDVAQTPPETLPENKGKTKEEPSQNIAQIKAELEAEKIRRIRAESVLQRQAERKKKEEKEIFHEREILTPW